MGGCAWGGRDGSVVSYERCLRDCQGREEFRVLNRVEWSGAGRELGTCICASLERRCAFGKGNSVYHYPQKVSR